MLALNPSSQHHRSWPAVTNRDVPSNRSRSTAWRSSERRKRRRRTARGRTRSDGVGKKGIGQTTTAFFPRETAYASTAPRPTARSRPLSTRETTVNFDLATAVAVFLIRSRPAKRRERPFPRQEPRDAGLRCQRPGGSAFVSFRSRLASHGHLDGASERPIITATGSRLRPDIVECLMSAAATLPFRARSRLRGGRTRFDFFLPFFLQKVSSGE